MIGRQVDLWRCFQEQIVKGCNPKTVDCNVIVFELLNDYNNVFVGCVIRHLPQTSSSKQNWIHSSEYRFVHILHPSNLSTEVECMSLWKAGCSTETGKTECTWETTNYIGFQPLVFAGCSEVIVDVFKIRSFCWIRFL